MFGSSQLPTLKPAQDESFGMPASHPRRDDDLAARGGSGRYSHGSGSGSNQPDKGEKKDDRGFVSRQGGDQSRGEGRKDKDDHD
jgi:hypothetical protein